MVNELIDELKRAESTSSILDAKLAIVVGWTFAKHAYVDASTGEQKYGTLWRTPEGEDAKSAPHYTTSIDAARRLAEQLCPDAQLACSWEPNLASGAVGDHMATATNPALALCIASLEYLQTTKK